VRPEGNRLSCTEKNVQFVMFFTPVKDNVLSAGGSINCVVKCQLIYFALYMVMCCLSCFDGGQKSGWMAVV
jgi:hypothetical protein